MRLLYLTFFLLSTPWLASANCPGCTINLPVLPADTIFISAAPDGQVGQYYSSDLSFRLPTTTTPVHANDPDTPPGLPISEITISSVANVPPGLSWEANQLEFDISEETDGCVRFCGTPLIPGFYEIEVIISAQVLVATQTSTVTLPLLILPGQAVSEGFTIDNTSGCGEVVANFINNVPSNGTAGFQYGWDFGNGQSSTAENPGPQVYEEPGEYGISYQVIIDTFGYQLTEVAITDVDCGDIFGGAPDLVLEVYDPLGEKIFSSDMAENASLPVIFQPNLFIEDGPYQIQVVDDDQGLDGGDDACGTFGFVRTTNGELEDNGATIEISIIHPVDTLRSEGVVTVFEQPGKPELQGYGGELLCDGDSVTLMTNYEAGTQWYQDTVPILDANGSELPVEESGIYWVTYTNEQGCSATSDTLLLDFNPLPAFPVFQNDNNLLYLLNPDTLPGAYSLQWSLDGQPLEGGQELEYCIAASGSYTLEVVNELTGCSRSYTQSIAYDPDFPDCMPVDVEEWHRTAWKVYPTVVTDGVIQVEGPQVAQAVHLQLLTLQGQVLRRWEVVGLGPVQEELSLPGLPSGYYILQLQGSAARSFPLIVPGR